jgi:hypothetical protein
MQRLGNFVEPLLCTVVVIIIIIIIVVTVATSSSSIPPRKLRKGLRERRVARLFVFCLAGTRTFFVATDQRREDGANRVGETTSRGRGVTRLTVVRRGEWSVATVSSIVSLRRPTRQAQ